MPPKAKWTISKPTTTVDAAGTATISAALLDGKVTAGTFTVTVTADRALRLDWVAAAGYAPLTDFQAWSKES